jgi:hypothetical protein
MFPSQVTRAFAARFASFALKSMAKQFSALVSRQIPEQRSRVQELNKAIDRAEGFLAK